MVLVHIAIGIDVIPRQMTQITEDGRTNSMMMRRDSWKSGDPCLRCVCVDEPACTAVSGCTWLPGIAPNLNNLSSPICRPTCAKEQSNICVAGCFEMSLNTQNGYTFSCAAGTTLQQSFEVPYDISTNADFQSFCCQSTCGNVLCPAGTGLVSDPFNMLGNARTCCKTLYCSDYTCPTQLLLRPNAGSIQGNDTATCCEASCSKVTCTGKNTVIIADAALTPGQDEATCCKTPCSAFSCPISYMPIANAPTLGGTDQKTCCKTLPNLLGAVKDHQAKKDDSVAKTVVNMTVDAKAPP